MASLKIQRVLALPGVVEASTLYIVRSPDTGLVDLHFTSQDGTDVRKIISKADIQAMIDASVPEVSDSASRLETPRTIEATGDATWSVVFDGSADVDAVLTLAASGVTAGEYPVVTVDAKGRVLSGRALDVADIPNLPGSKITSDLSVNTTGNAATATLADEATVAVALKTSRTINGVAFDGSADIVINAEDSVARIAATEKGAANGVAPLDGNSLIPSQYLPSYVDDVIEVPDEASLPTEGETGKIYVTVDNSKIFRWTGSVYIAIPGGVGLADEALRLATPRAIALSGDATGSEVFDGSADISIAVTLANAGTAGEQDPVVTTDAKGRVISSRALVAGDIPELDYNKVVSAASVELAADEW